MAIRGGRPNERRIAPHLLVHDGRLAVDFYKRAFGATELYRSIMPGGTGIHSQLRIAESVILITQAAPSSDAPSTHSPEGIGSPQALQGTSVILELYVDDVDAVFQRAIKAGATSISPLMDTFFGDRYGQVRDPFGHIWGLATVKEELAPEEVAKRMAAYSQKG